MIQPSITTPSQQSLIENKDLSLSQTAYHVIRQKIISLEFPPGAVIDESSLRQELGLGRTPIREALQRLAMEKLVTIVPRRGTFVTQIRLTDLQRLSETRLVLEVLAVRLACQRGTNAHWRRMAQVLDDLDREDVLDNEAMVTADEACHHIIYEATDNEFLEDALISLYALSLRLWYFAISQIGGMHDAVLEHKSILEALQMRDEERAARLIEQHILTFHNEIQSVVLGASTSSKHSRSQ